MTQFNMSYAGSIPFSDMAVQLSLSANTLLTYTVPGENSIEYRVLFSWNVNSDVWVGYKVTATLPTVGTIFQVNSIERNPDIRYVRGGDILSFISRSAVADAGLSLLRLA